MGFLVALFWNRTERRIPAVWRLIVQTLLLLLLLLLLAVILALTIPLDLDQAEFTSMSPLALDAVVPLVCVEAVALIVSVYVAARFLDRRSFANLGLGLDRAWWLDLLFGLALGIALTSAVFLVHLAAGWIAITGWCVPGRPGQTFISGFARMLFVFVIVGLTEELLSRGYHLRNMAEGLCCRLIGPQAALWLGLLVSSLVFAVLHLANPSITPFCIINLLLTGVVLGLAYVLTGRLALPIGLHVTWNLFQGNVYGFAVSGEPPRATWIATAVDGPESWTGGAFGPEGGLLATLANLVGCVLIVLWVRHRTGHIRLHTHLAQYVPPQVALARPAAEITEPGEETPGSDG
jgi:membrane protease YdiL (CAAX protease family)